MPTNILMQIMDAEESRVIAGVRQDFQFRSLVKENLSMEIAERKRDGFPKIPVGRVPHQPRPWVSAETNNHDAPIQ
jgi:hypothetical protein